VSAPPWCTRDGRATRCSSAGPGPRPSVRLFFGARTSADLYDLPSLRRLARARPSVAVIPVVSDEPGCDGLEGSVAEAAAAHLPPGTEDVAISGAAGMVARAPSLVTAEAPSARLHLDQLPGAGRPL
jgi:NAD(P)H-flavin reductase